MLLSTTATISDYYIEKEKAFQHYQQANTKSTHCRFNYKEQNFDNETYYYLITNSFQSTKIVFHKNQQTLVKQEFYSHDIEQILSLQEEL